MPVSFDTTLSEEGIALDARQLAQQLTAARNEVRAFRTMVIAAHELAESAPPPPSHGLGSVACGGGSPAQLGGGGVARGGRDRRIAAREALAELSVAARSHT